MAVESVTGATPAWFVEYDAAPSKILAHHWPDVPNYGDVTNIDWSTMPPVDILTGGYPCQPFSQAGQRKGTTDERHLWPYVREAIRVLRPRLTILENVAGHRSLGFDRVLGDMAEDGLHVRWTSIRASDIGAPHHRERLFILATPTDPEGSRRDHGKASHVGTTNREKHAPRDDSHAATDTEGERFSGQQQSSRSGEAVAGTNGSLSAFPDSDSRRWGFGPYAPAVRRWERLTRPAPVPTELNTKGNPRLNAEFASWMMGLPEGHVTQVPGISRADQLKAIGNGVCPQQAAAALTTLLEKETF